MAFRLGVCLPGLAIAAYGRTATRLPTRPVVDSNHRSHRRQIYSLEQPRRIPDVFGFVPLLFPCLLVQDYLLEF